MFDARSEFHKLGKGAMMIGLWSGQTPPTNFDFVGNCDSVTLSADVTTVQKFSNTRASGALVDRRTLRTAYKVAAQIDEFTKENLKLFLLGTEATKTQNLAAVSDITINDIELGKYYDLGKRRITGAVVYVNEASTAMVEGTDYELNTEFGWFRAISGGAIVALDDVRVHCSVPALTIMQIRIAQASSPIARLRFLCDDANNESSVAKDELNVWKASIAPSGDLNLISDDYGSYSLEFSVISDSTNHPNDPFGTLDRITG